MPSMISKVFTSITICGLFTAYGQSTATVSGIVVNEGSQQSVPGSITVMTSSSGIHLRTADFDDTGRFSLTVPVGAAVIVARADGYASQQREIVVRAGANPPLSFSLARAASVSGRV